MSGRWLAAAAIAGLVGAPASAEVSDPVTALRRATQLVADVDAVLPFYRDMLGLPQEVYSEPDQWAEFNCGNVTLSLLRELVEATATGDTDAGRGN